ncbi:VPLPA-CTERM protein sorting domain-containing protein [Malonomonas rubra DSM 5091]|uniref:VPLPA-CTERM protein sorting domain-containing protein n=1 Tax=Malonomonas rubra DSM 5091 TaxID=1122189 RepID=A0A1M6MMT8_MALRU|nr:PEP-CTERM sorting domain-containing protein [Malonomonas rubra]SHJ84772.1 VPLPA-CTERM protein sorting domain-containing protein [Malonomonas rubra DSM 5091]
MKKQLIVWLVGFLLLVMSSIASAVTVGSETILTAPSSTEDLWAYSYQSNASYISSAADYVRASDPYSDAIFQGYVTGDYGPWSPTHDSFSSGGLSDYRTVHVFETYITSSINQTIYFAASGDDGHSIFIDNVFLDGDGYNVTSLASLDMFADTQYKLTFIGSNYTGPWSWWFNMRGNYDSSSGTYGWSGPVSEGSSISMNASKPAPVPEPTTALLLGSGLAGLALYRHKRKKFD